jgi:hypothetical protein
MFRSYDHFQAEIFPIEDGHTMVALDGNPEPEPDHGQCFLLERHLLFKFPTGEVASVQSIDLCSAAATSTPPAIGNESLLFHTAR